jgi:hypothetical protein
LSATAVRKYIPGLQEVKIILSLVSFFNFIVRICFPRISVTVILKSFADLFLMLKTEVTGFGKIFKFKE